MLGGATAVFAAATSLTGCHRSPSPAGDPVTMQVRLVGCTALLRDGTCLLSDRSPTLHVFVPSSWPVQASAAHGVAAVTLEQTFDEGRRYTLTFGKDAGAVTLALAPSRRGGSLRRRPAFEVRANRAPAWRDDEAPLLAKQDYEGALRVVREALSGGDPLDAFLALRQIARLELAQGHVDESAATFRQAIDRGRVLGRVSDTVDDAFALSFALCDQGHLCAQAREVLDGLGDLVADYPSGWAREPHYRGLILSNLGDHRAALHLLHEAERRAALLGLDSFHVYNDGALTRELDRVGALREEALALRRKDLADLPSDAADERTMLENGIGFGRLMLAM